MGSSKDGVLFSTVLKCWCHSSPILYCRDERPELRVRIYVVRMLSLGINVSQSLFDPLLASVTAGLAFVFMPCVFILCALSLQPLLLLADVGALFWCVDRRAHDKHRVSDSMVASILTMSCSKYTKLRLCISSLRVKVSCSRLQLVLGCQMGRQDPD